MGFLSPLDIIAFMCHKRTLNQSDHLNSTFLTQMIYFREKHWQIKLCIMGVRADAFICMFILLAFMTINVRDEPRAVKQAYEKLSLSKKTFLAANFSLFIKSSLDNFAYEASLHRIVTYAIYSETCIIVLGQLLIRLLILIKQSLPKRKHHLFYHGAYGINDCSM